MQWRGRRQSGNVDDQRGSSGVGGMAFKGGLGTIVIVVDHQRYSRQEPINPSCSKFRRNRDPASSEQNVDWQPTAEETELGQFVSVVLADTEDVWNSLLEDYREPTLVLFSGGVQSGCGSASSSTGPFYCSEDEKVYIDLSFYEDLKNRLWGSRRFCTGLRHRA